MSQHVIDRPALEPVLPNLLAHGDGRDLVTLSPNDPAYGRFVRTHPYRSLFSSPEWIAVIEAGYGLKAEILARLAGGEIVAALPFCRVRDMRGERIAALPFSDYTDPLVTDPVHASALVGHLARAGLATRLRTLHNPLFHQDPRLRLLPAEALWHAVNLDRPLDALWAGFDGSARQNVRKAERSGVTARIGLGLEDVLLFHRMHAHLRKTKYRMLAQPRRFFEAIHAILGADGRVAVAIAEAEGEPVAGILLIEWQDTLYYKFNASFDTRLRPNDLLAWQAIRHAKERGLGWFDFGLSDADQPGLVRYKRKFATEEKAIHQLAMRPVAPAEPHETAAGAMLGRLTELFTRPDVPDDVTREAGDALYRYFA